MKYEVMFGGKEGTWNYEGTPEGAAKIQELYDMQCIYENDVNFVFVSALQATIFEFDDVGRILAKCNPMPYLRKTNPELKKLTRERVKELVEDLKLGKVDYDEVRKAELGYDLI